MATATAFTARDHPQDRAQRLNRLRDRVDDIAGRTVHIEFTGKPDAAQRLARVRIPLAATILAISGEFDIPATSPAPFLLKAEGVTIGTLPANAAQTTGAITYGPVAADTLLELDAPTLQDATLAGGIIRITLAI